MTTNNMTNSTNLIKEDITMTTKKGTKYTMRSLRYLLKDIHMIHGYLDVFYSCEVLDIKEDLADLTPRQCTNWYLSKRSNGDLNIGGHFVSAKGTDYSVVYQINYAPEGLSSKEVKCLFCTLTRRYAEASARLCGTIGSLVVTKNGVTEYSTREGVYTPEESERRYEAWERAMGDDL